MVPFVKGLTFYLKKRIKARSHVTCTVNGKADAAVTQRHVLYCCCMRIQCKPDESTKEAGDIYVLNCRRVEL